MEDRSINKELFTPVAPNTWKPWLVASFASIIILGIAVWLMNAIGLFSIPKDDTGTKTLAAALALTGTVLSTVVTLVGIVVKYSIDDRNARQASLEASRNYALALEAEQRNRIEAAIRAVDLLSENNKDATNNQIGGALLALVSLGELDLAVALLAQLWPSGNTSPTIAETVLSNAFKSQSSYTQKTAATVLFQNSSKIEQDGYYIWPITNDWNTDLHPNCRLGLILSAAEWLITQLQKDKSRLPDAIVVIHKALDDPDAGIADIAHACLVPLIDSFPAYFWVTNAEGVRCSMEDIKAKIGTNVYTPLTSYGETYQSRIQNIFLSTPTAE